MTLPNAGNIITPPRVFERMGSVSIRRFALVAVAALQLTTASGLAAEAHRLPPSGPQKHITDSDLLAYVRSAFDRRSKMGKREVLGLHQNTLVVVDFPCSDLCPAYTTRIIHYDVPADPKICARVGGVLRQEWVPKGIAVMPMPFCLPKSVAAVEAARALSRLPHKPGPARQPPQLKRPFDEYFTDYDYPISALRMRKSGTVQVGLDVGVDGRVSRCRIRHSSGVPALDRETCRIARSRSRFQPALDASGVATVSQSIFAHTWRLPASNAAH
jgi:TonB family protein